MSETVTHIVAEGGGRVASAPARAEAQPTLELVLRESLKLLHPFMPFVTEAVWEELNEKELLIKTPWPTTS